MSSAATFDPRTVMEINSRSISLMLGGNYGESQQVLNSGLEMLQRAAVQLAPPQETDEKGLLSLPATTPPINKGGMWLESIPVPFINNTNIAGSSSEIFTFFNRALRIHLLRNNNDSCSPQTASSPSKQLLERMAAVLLYNSALLHHLQGLKHARTRNFQVALQLYGMAMNLVSRENALIHDEDTILILGVLNNMGQIHEGSLANHVEASSCLNLIQNILEAITKSDTTCSATNCCILSEEETAFFSLTLFLFPFYHKGSAPAA